MGWADADKPTTKCCRQCSSWGGVVKDESGCGRKRNEKGLGDLAEVKSTGQTDVEVMLALSLGGWRTPKWDVWREEGGKEKG